MEMKVDMHEFEKQRYKAIKNSNKYIELKVLIGTENEEFDGHVGRMPVVSTEVKNCGEQEMACLYSTLRAYIDHLEKEYPVECLLGKMAMDINHASTVVHYNKEDEENKEEN